MSVKIARVGRIVQQQIKGEENSPCATSRLYSAGWFWVSPLSAAQGKISAQWKCDGTPVDQHNIAVPDHEGHSYSIAQGKCTAQQGSMGDTKEQAGTFTEFDEMNGIAVQNHGVFVDTLASGDKVFYQYHGTQAFKDGKMQTGENKWTLSGGTGKYKVVKGEGSCKGKTNADGSSIWDCVGSYSGVK